MKRLSVILMACLLVLGMSQCKKEKPNETNEESVSISLKVVGDNAGSKVNVTPGESTATVTYEDNDVIYVVSEGKYVGTLTRTNNIFTGGVTGAVENKPLSFFFLGNKDVEALTAGESTSCTVDISDQTTGLPVVSCGTSTEIFKGVTASYTCQLNNQCALVKFDLGSVNTDETITITGVTNELTVNFNGTVTSAGTGDIATYGTGTTRYAIVAKNQVEVTNGTASATGYDGTFSMAAASTNGYIDATVTLTASGPASIGPFTVSDDNGTTKRKVYFAPGNLKCSKKNNAEAWSDANITWSFMEHQYSTVETTWQDVGENYSNQNVVGLFCWNTWTEDGGDPWTAIVGNKSCSDNTGDMRSDISADLGSWWFILSQNEWNYLINSRETTTNLGTENARYAKAYLDTDSNGSGDTRGLIVFPDYYQHPTGVAAPSGINVTGVTSWNGNNYNATDWGKMEAAGALFLPAAGSRCETGVYDVGDQGRYWSSTYNLVQYHSIAKYASALFFDNNELDIRNPWEVNFPYDAFSVRLVRLAD